MPSQLGTKAETLRDRRTTPRERPQPEFFRSTSIERRKLGFYEIEREDFVQHTREHTWASFDIEGGIKVFIPSINLRAVVVPRLITSVTRRAELGTTRTPLLKP